MRIRVRPRTMLKLLMRKAPPDFQGPTRAHRTMAQPPRWRGSSGWVDPHLRANRFRGTSFLKAVKKKRELFSGRAPGSRVSFPLPAQSPFLGRGILTALPFGAWAPGRARPEACAVDQNPTWFGRSATPQDRLTLDETHFSRNPSLLQPSWALTRVVATTTKICTRGGSTAARAAASSLWTRRAFGKTRDAKNTPASAYSRPSPAFLTRGAAEYGRPASAPSIFRATRFGR